MASPLLAIPSSGRSSEGEVGSSAPQKPQHCVAGIVFDMDGVLLASSSIHEAAFVEVLRPFDVDFRYPPFAGMRTRETLTAILKDHGIELPSERLNELSNRKSALALARIQSENPIAPGARDVLEHLRSRFPLALASSASEASVAAFLENNGLRDFFQLVLAAGSVQESKPAPDIYRKAIARLQVDPDRCLVIEDAVAGIRAAKAAGAIAWGLTGTSSSEELGAAGADRIIDDLGELRAL